MLKICAYEIVRDQSWVNWMSVSIPRELGWCKGKGYFYLYIMHYNHYTEYNSPSIYYGFLLVHQIAAVFNYMEIYSVYLFMDRSSVQISFYLHGPYFQWYVRTTPNAL